jgi:tetrahydromethanopterin S-methyltransferase subunit A
MAKNIQVNQSINKLMYGAFLELMLESYGNTDRLIGFDHNLKVKHHNILKNWERESAGIFRFLEGSGNEEVIKQYHQIVNIVDRLMGLSDLEAFTVILNFIDEYLDGDVKIIEEN